MCSSIVRSGSLSFPADKPGSPNAEASVSERIPETAYIDVPGEEKHGTKRQERKSFQAA